MADVNIYKKMKMMGQDYVYLVLVLVILCFLDLCYSQSDPPRNVETHYPFPYPPTPRVPPALPNAPPPPPQSTSSRPSKKAIITAVAATAASAFVLAALLFLLFTRFSRKRRHRPPSPLPASGTRSEFKRHDGDVKGYVVDEDGLDMLYWKKLNPDSADDAGGRSSTSDDHRSGSSTSSSSHSPADPQAIPPPPPPPRAPAPKKKADTTPPPPPKPSANAPKPPPLGGRKKPEAASGSGSDQVKLKALHWEKVNISHERSNVWDQIEGGSFQYNGDMMEALFGVAVNKRKPLGGEKRRVNPGEASNRIFILDQRKSQNIAIVIKSLGVTLEELMESLVKGKGLNAETLEKVARMAPKQEEVSEIMAFSGDTTKLADAESFLYSLLKAVPSAFNRANEMLFTFTYHYETDSIKESLRTMEAACEELRSHGVFLKLLEAILKAGNRLNAGTARGDAKAFSLTTLRKLSDYKSKDGKSTLLHFVVHEVVRNEGRRCSAFTSASSSPQADDLAAKEEREKEYIRLGLPVVAGLSSEFSDVKKAANIDYDVVKSTIASLANRVKQATEMVANSASDDEDGGFVKEMRAFLASAGTEMKGIQEHHDRVMELVNKTTSYYQAKASNDKNPAQLFVLVKDFLSMVDLACVEIARSVQQKKQPKPESGSGSASGSPLQKSSHSDGLKSRMTFPRLPENFMSDKSSSSSGDDS